MTYHPLELKLKALIETSEEQDWYHRFEIVSGSNVFTPGRVYQDYNLRLKLLEKEADFFKGKRVLDIGAYSGSFSFFLEDCGADVVALDVYDPNRNGFNIVHKLRDSTVEHIRASVYDLNPETFGYFDVVAFYGVFYHLKHPLLALERINSVCKQDGLLIGGGTGSEAWFHDEDQSCERGVNFQNVNRKLINDKSILNVEHLNELSLCGFSENQFFRDPTNWFLPNQKCLDGWLRTAGFSVEKIKTFTTTIERHWNINNLQRSSHSFKAVKVNPPKQEYTRKEMKGYNIPTEPELERVKAELQSAKNELENLKRKLTQKV